MLIQWVKVAYSFLRMIPELFHFSLKAYVENFFSRFFYIWKVIHLNVNDFSKLTFRTRENRRFFVLKTIFIES